MTDVPLGKPLNATPCPKCGKRCDLVPGINAPHGSHGSLYVVCWRCDVMREVATYSAWFAFGKKRTTKVKAA